MNLDILLSNWKTDPSIAPNITAWEIVAAQDPVFKDLPHTLHPQIRDILQGLQIDQLYLHQRDAWEKIQSGKDLVLATGTASGKSLAYQLPIADSIYKDPQSKALLLFPTKALARDQLEWLHNFPAVKAFPYDGDTPSNHRKQIRDNANIIISNPDMLHLGILPYHTNWTEFFAQLKFIVLDEIHVYRGVFGSHVANVIHRLLRLAAHYGSSPQFILTSATIGNPRELAESLTSREFALIADDYSSHGRKHFLLYNPPVIEPDLGLRASMQRETVRLAADLVSKKLQTIIFGRSRRSVEFMLLDLENQVDLPDQALQAYRSGFLPEKRREIEAGLRAGTIRGITSTTALELGIDIGGLDCAILAGYPGTISGSWQQAGRAGRSETPSLAVLVASSNPLDQYLIRHPEFLFQSNPENGLVDPNNLLIVLAHLQCAAYELPFQPGSAYGEFTSTQTHELLEALRELGSLHYSSGTYYWMSQEYPAAAISLRSASMDQILLQLQHPDGSRTALGTIDFESGLWMVHPGAIYIHAGGTYRVTDLNLETRIALLENTSQDYFTEAEKQTEFSLLDEYRHEIVQGGELAYGEIRVKSQITGYKVINWHPYQVLSKEKLDLPATELNTMGCWLTLSEQTEDQLRKAGLWSSSPNDYGPDWPTIRTAVLTRDQYRCASCGKSDAAQSLHVHHKQPLRSFQSLPEANQLSNLVSLCPRCHQRAEAVVRINSGIRGLGYIFHSLAPLLLMCDPADIGLYVDFSSPFGIDRPFLLLYEHIPAGIGYSSHIFRNYPALLKMAFQAVDACSCRSGCPSCVGPGGESGAGGKPETMAILRALYLKQLADKT